MELMELIAKELTNNFLELASVRIARAVERHSKLLEFAELLGC